jgi:hypothetical protein
MTSVVHHESTFIRGRKVILTATLDASSPGVLLPFDVPDVRRIELLRRGPTMLALFSIGELPPVIPDTPKEQPNIGPWLNEPLPLRELPLFLPLGST